MKPGFLWEGAKCGVEGFLKSGSGGAGLRPPVILNHGTSQRNGSRCGVGRRPAAAGGLFLLVYNEYFTGDFQWCVFLLFHKN